MKMNYIEVLVPKENINDEYVTLLSWVALDQSQVTEGAVIAELETSKASFVIESPSAGKIHHMRQEKEEIQVGDILCRIEVACDEKTDSSIASEETVSCGKIEVATEKAEGGPIFSKKARQMLEEHKIVPQVFPEGEMIRSRDIEEYLSGSVFQKSVSSGEFAQSQTPSRSKQAEIRLLQEGAHSTIPSVVVVSCETAGMKRAIESQGVIVTSLLVYETSRLLRKYPEFNGRFEGGKQFYYEKVNIGIAVNAGLGLKVPVVHDADKKTLLDIHEEIVELLSDYMNESLDIKQLFNATFTITDLSNENVFIFQPVISAGQSAILGIGGEYFPPGCPTGMFNLILSFDHQMSEGLSAARFLSEITARLSAYESAFRSGKKPEKSEYICDYCHRTLREIREMNAYLVPWFRSESEKPSKICSICLAGY